MRDSEKSKTYEAEFQVRSLLKREGTVEMLGTHVAIPAERRFGRVEDVQRYVDAVLEHIGCADKITVRKRQGVKSAHYERVSHVIAVPDADWSLREIVVLHEIAHHLTSESEADHGQEFRRNFCDLLEKVLAPEARFLMQVAFMERGLKV